EGARVAGGGESIHLRPSWIRQAQELGGFVEAFPGGVIERGAKQNMIKFTTHVDQHGVPAADDQGNIWTKPREIGAGRFRGNPGGIQMRFVMMHTDKWFAQGEGDGLPRATTNHEGIGKPGTAR